MPEAASLVTADTSFPMRQLLLVCAVRIAEPISLSITMPFIYFMVRDFGLGPEEDVGSYVGFLTAAFSVAQLISAMPFGILSDRAGRRPVVLFGLATTSLGMLAFGVSKSYSFALTTKIISGLLDGNVAPLKSMVSEMTMHNTEADRTWAFSVLQVIFAVGSIIGSMLGGYLSEPVRKYPFLFDRGGWLTDFFTAYPYFLPCFVATLIGAAAWMVSYLYLEETLVVDNDEKLGDAERRPLLSQAPVSYTSGDDSHTTNAPLGDDTKGPMSMVQKLTSSLTLDVILCCILYGTVAYQDIFYDELIPLWSATPIQSGGLGLTSTEIGTAFSFAGIVVLVVQCVLHRLAMRFSMLSLFRFSLLISIFIYLFQGCARYLPDSLIWSGMLIGFGLKSFAITISFTGLVVLLNNATTRADVLGSINAISQCCSAAMRAMGPATAGLIWSWSIQAIDMPLWLRLHFSWVSAALVGVVSFMLGMMLMRS
ncbi:major facilitator superfamily domain-containing protein [Syncephalastrum racemosum]|uniref:Major facilitator superfamily domain-containing protein n=1 Tax=Syncephalastrum racemosum TaxID=13706 RepID=A0A1X2HUG5_SYNRA|nr:major facilitator superfamily domain-containing protein [Syncephalastrum racemosum]